MGKGALGQTHLEELVTIITNLLNTHFKRQEDRQEQRKDEDYDEVVEESLLNEVQCDIIVHENRSPHALDVAS